LTGKRTTTGTNLGWAHQARFRAMLMPDEKARGRERGRDASSVAALDAVETKHRAYGRAVTFTGLHPRSLAFHGRLTGQLQA